MYVCVCRFKVRSTWMSEFSIQTKSNKRKYMKQSTKNIVLHTYIGYFKIPNRNTV